ncbi:amino acid adenylation domain-containing protein [Corallococcus terminator]
MSDSAEYATEGIAIVGLAGRFPKAPDIETFWENLRTGLRAISTFSEEELLAAGHAPETVRHPRYVRARGALDDTALFDAAFFDFNAREAELTDPQHRLFLECAWEALEDASYDASRYTGRIGVFAGASMSTYLLDALRGGQPLPEGLLQLAIGNLSDFLSTRLAYKLDLRGPSVSVQTACSTSLVATHLACLHLLAGQCDLALAGGVSARAQEVGGYLHQEGGIFSPDGHCRAFDARAQGTVEGSGVGLVVLMRLEDALAEGAHIRAVIRGTAINNDGRRKVGFTAPSVQGQAEAIAMAQRMSGVSADSISYVEAHGTGTGLGDPIEVAALGEAFGRDAAPNTCALGSIKASIGHLDAAAGVAGLIKTALALEHRQLPPSIDFEQLNPRIDLSHSPLYVNTRLADWPDRGTPRRGCVSSFGIGGTNAHAVLEEAPPRPPSEPTRAAQLLVLSARTPTALEAMSTRLSRHLTLHPEQSLADVAYSLQVGRRPFSHRRALVCRGREEAVAALSGEEPGVLLSGTCAPSARPVAFMFSGQGAQYVDMGKGLYEHEPVFRQELERCARLLQPHLDLDLLQVLYPRASQRDEATALLGQTSLTQPALFALEYSLARLWESWGVRPSAMMGHSVGEYVAACIAGVFSLEDALAVISTRGQLIQQLPRGAMLAIPLPPDELRPLLGDTLSLAAINAPALCVAAGPTDAMENLERRLTERGVAHTRLHTSHAFHSTMMEPALEPFAARLTDVTLRAPRIPIVSNVTGDWMTDAEATHPHYWVRHLREEVRFSDGLKCLFAMQAPLLLEVGPGRTLSTLALQHPERPADCAVHSSLRHPKDTVSDDVLSQRTLGQLWSAGVDVSWDGLHANARRRRVPLPTYPFERQRYLLGHAPSAPASAPVLGPTTKHERPGLATTYVEPTSELERRVAAIWQECLGFAPIGAHDSFFELGGHSLLATQIVSRIHAEFGIAMPLSKLFETPTVAGLASRLDVAGLQPERAPAFELLPRDGELPLSFAQQRMWALERFDPGSSAYHLPQALRLRGPLDVDLLQRSLDALTRRHESLRTVFPSTDGSPVQHVLAPTPVTVRQVELQGLAEEQLLTEEAERPFDLASGPLMRVTLVRLAHQEHLLLLTLHHIIADGWSLRVLTRELVELYTALRQGRLAVLAELPLQYGDYARWQRHWLQGPVLESRLDYWKEHLAGLPALELPTDRPRPATPDPRAGSLPFRLSPELCADLETLARQEGATSFMVLLAAFSAVLGRYSGQEDFAVGSPIAGRNQTRFEGLIGLFVNTLVLRTSLAGAPTGSELLARVKDVALAAYAHQELPFEKLVEVLQPTRDPSRSPLFQVMFSLQEAASDSLTLDELRIERWERGARSTQFDLTLWLRPGSRGFEGALEFNRGLFDEPSVHRLSVALTQTLQNLTDDPGRELGELTLPSGAQRAELLAALTGEPGASTPSGGVHQWLEHQARLWPDRPALRTATETLSHGEVDRRARRVAHLLRDTGVHPGDRVGLCLERSTEAIVAMLGVLKAGAAYVPLDSTAPPARLHFLLEEVEAPVVLTCSALAPKVSGGKARVILLDNPGVWAEGDEQALTVDVEVCAESAAYVLFTSGSTGRPKGVVVPHRALMNHLRGTHQEYELSPDDRVLQFSALSVDVAAEEIFPTLAAGASVVIREMGAAESVAELLQLLETTGVTVVNVPAPYWHEWVDELPRLPVPLPSSVRLVVTGSQAPSVERLARWRERVDPRVRWLNAYGPTEATITATVFEPEASVEAARLPIGRPLAGVRLYILDEHLRPVPPGALGELFIGGRGLALGYLSRAALTAEAFLPDPFSGEAGARMYRTRDLARLLPDGNVDFLGRRDHQVKVRGFRIELGEVEATLEQLPEVREAVVLHRQGPSGDARLEAYVVPAGEGLTEGALRVVLESKLPRYMVPARLVLRTRLPRLASGKVDRQELAASSPKGEPTDTITTPPRDAMEEALVRVWAEVLKREPVGVHDNFFELGGDSLMAIRVVARANQVGLPLTARQVLQHQTVAQLAAVARRPPEASGAQATTSGHEVPLTPPQRRFLEQEHPAPHHWNRSLLLEVLAPLHVETLREAVRQLLHRHDALRLRFTRDEEGWHQLDSQDTRNVPFSTVDLSTLPESELPTTLEAQVGSLQRSLSLTQGPLFRLTWFDLGPQRPGRLLVLFHFLIADGVSWALFTDELQALYARLLEGLESEEHLAPLSFKAWAEHQRTLADSHALQEEAARWWARLSPACGQLPFDHTGVNTEGSMRSVRVELTPEETWRLLQRAAQARSGLEALLLTPLAQVLCHWMDGAALRVDLGRHGRDEQDGLDPSGTMGCLAADCPVRLELPGDGGLAASLEAVDLTLHETPARGLGHGLLCTRNAEDAWAQRLRALPPAQVSFDYMSQRMLGATAMFRLAPEPSGPDRDPFARRSHVLQLIASRVGDRLQVDWRYSDAVHERATVERLAQAYLEGLRALAVPPRKEVTV